MVVEESSQLRSKCPKPAKSSCCRTWKGCSDSPAKMPSFILSRDSALIQTWQDYPIIISICFCSSRRRIAVFGKRHYLLWLEVCRTSKESTVKRLKVFCTYWCFFCSIFLLSPAKIQVRIILGQPRE